MPLFTKPPKNISVPKAEYLSLLYYRDQYNMINLKSFEAPKLDGYDDTKDFLLIAPDNVDSVKVQDVFKYIKLPYIFVIAGGTKGKQFFSYKEPDVKPENGRIICPYCGTKYKKILERCTGCNAPNEYFEEENGNYDS